MNWKYVLAILLVLVIGIGLSVVSPVLALVSLIAVGFVILITIKQDPFVYKYKVKLGEFKVLILIVALLFTAFFVAGGYQTRTTVYVNPYSLNIKLTNNSAIVSESFVYHVPKGIVGHRFYRTYYKYGPLSEMRVLNISCPIGKPIKTSDKLETTLGCYNRDGIGAGVYNITYRYVIPKPYACYQNLCLFDWNVLNNFGLTILGGHVQVLNAKKVWGYPPNLNSFSLPPHTLLEVKAIVPKSFVSAYWVETNKPDSQIFSNEWQVSLAGSFYKYGWLWGLLFVFIISAGLYLIYLKFGKEPESFGIPDVYHDLPSHRKPYDVARIAFGDPNTIEFEGIQATLLDLARRGWVEIDGHTIRFKQGKDQLDEYEKRVYDTYKWLGSYTGGDLDVEQFKKAVSSVTYIQMPWLRDIKMKMEALRKYGKSVYSSKGKVIAVGWLILWGAVFVALGWLMPKWLFKGLMASVLTGGLSLWLLDAYTFGRYDPKIYKEVQLWKAFGRLLGDYSLIKKYGPQDMNMWGDWLIYATALGKADNVIKAMKEFNVRLPYIDYNYSYMYLYPGYIYTPVSTRYTALSAANSGAGWSGGGGFGGGFGGGGGGFG